MADDSDATLSLLESESDTESTEVDASVALSWTAHIQTYGDTSGSTSDATSAVTIGTTGKSKRLEALTVSVSSAVSGSITYSAHVQDVGWQDWVSEGEVAGTTGQSKRVEAVKIQLTGDLADYYDVYYRVHVQTGGWLGWAKNGAIAGTTGISYRVEAVQVVIVAKGASAPGSTANASFSSISGDHTLDRYLMKIYLTQGTNLKTLYQYVSTYTYIRTYDTPSGSWSSWSITYAKEMYANQGGNCYRYAALFCWLARGLGYDATVVTGYVPSRSSGWAPHGWCEITVDGTVYIVDPDLYKSYPSYNWYMVTYANAPTTYKKSS